MSAIYIYLDWNVFDRLQKIQQLNDSDKEAFTFINNLIKQQNVVVPYSNAHINDLIRGYKKNPTYTQGDLSFITQITGNLAVVQYWGHDQVTWHQRDVFQFFEDALEEKSNDFDSLEKLCEADEFGMMKAMMELFKSVPLPDNFSKSFEFDPVFDKIFATSREKLTMYSLMDDLLKMSSLLKTDYSIYKSLRVFTSKIIKKYKNAPNLKAQLQALDNQEALNFLKASSDEMYEWAKNKSSSKTSDNSDYSKVIDTYLKIDWRGYKSDERFDNMIDDALHTFYAAHCHFFITEDDRCHYKATETFKELGILAQVFKPKEFLSFVGQTLKDGNSEQILRAG